MRTAGIDVGSLTAKAVVMDDGRIVASSLMPAGPDPARSADSVIRRCLKDGGIPAAPVQCCCGTGYGRLTIPFADLNMSEISCHGMGAFWSNGEIRTIVDIGGQDCKVVAINDEGMVTDFVMNDKCAAGTGRSLEILARTLGVPLEELGELALKSRRPAALTNKCSVFMEIEVIELLCRKKRPAAIAHGIADAVARRVAALAGTVPVAKGVCVTGGVAKNRAVVRCIEKRLGSALCSLGIDPQLAGAAGAAVYAFRSITGKTGGGPL